MDEFVHCDDLIDDESQPEPLRKYLSVERLPAVYKWQVNPRPVLFAKMKQDASSSDGVIIVAGTWVRVVMASRFGDVGITTNLTAKHGYSVRVPLLDYLTDFRSEPPA